ncbi:MAG: molybdopterin-dependent oxidoreductase [Candidatus Aquicultor sp.]
MSERRTVLTTCTRDCPDACGINVYVTNDRLVGLTGAKDHEITKHFLCRKALNYIQRVYSKDRILEPLLKVDGTWQEVSWETALSAITGRLVQTIDRHGSLSVLHYQSSGSLGALKMLNKRFFNLLGGVTEASGSLCGGAGIAGQTMDFGYRTCHDPLDLLNSRLIIVWGRNPSETNMHLTHILKEARSGGARVILVDPVGTDTAKYCDMHISPKPGMDGYLALGMAKIILESDLAEKSFIDNYTANIAEYRSLLESFDIETLSEKCGVSVEDIATLARLYGGRKPAAIVCGWGLQRYEWGAETFRLIDALGAITGNIGISGGGINHGHDEAYYFDESVKGKEFARQTRKIPKPLLGKAIAGLDDPPIKMAFINGGNPLNQSPDIASVAEAFKNIDFVVVLEQFMTDTAEGADLVLPVTTFLEEHDVIGSYWHNLVGLVNPAIEPVGNARSDFEIYQDLANFLGFGEEMAGTPESWIRKIIKPLRKSGITYESLLESHKRIPEAPMVAYGDRLFQTESGKFNFITAFSTSEIQSTGYPLALLSTHSRRWIHSQLIPDENKSLPIAKVNPATAGKYGIEDAETARVASAHGELTAVIKHDESVRESIVHIEQGRWARFGQSLNQLTPALMSNEGQNACYYQTAVKLEKI